MPSLLVVCWKSDVMDTSAYEMGRVDRNANLSFKYPTCKINERNNPHTHEDLQGLQPTPLINVIERNGNNIKCIKFRVLY